MFISKACRKPSQAETQRGQDLAAAREWATPDRLREHTDQLRGSDGRVADYRDVDDALIRDWRAATGEGLDVPDENDRWDRYNEARDADDRDQASREADQATAAPDERFAAFHDKLDQYEAGQDSKDAPSKGAADERFAPFTRSWTSTTPGARAETP
jgi:hypothetical protein